MWHYCAPKVEAIYLHNRVYIAYNRKGLTTFAVFCLSLFVATKEKPISGIGCRSPPFNLDFSKKFRLEVKNSGIQPRKGRAQMAALERERRKDLRECGVDEETIEEIRTFDREEFNSDRRFYTRLNDVGEYIAETAMQEPLMEVNTVWDMLNEIEDENLYRALLTVDKRTLQIVLLKMQGYSLKEIAPMVDLSAGAVYARLDHLRKKLRKLL